MTEVYVVINGTENEYIVAVCESLEGAIQAISDDHYYGQTEREEIVFEENSWFFDPYQEGRGYTITKVEVQP